MLISFLVYYGVYKEGGASASKAPVDPEEDWVSRVDLALVPPPLSVTSLKRVISLKEGITSLSQLFTNGDVLTPVINDHILTENGKWPGSTPDDHIMFKFKTQLPLQTALPTFSEGTHYMILNSAGKALALQSCRPDRDIYVLDLPAHPGFRYHTAIFVRIPLVTWLII